MRAQCLTLWLENKVVQKHFCLACVLQVSQPCNYFQLIDQNKNQIRLCIKSPGLWNGPNKTEKEIIIYLHLHVSPTFYS